MSRGAAVALVVLGVLVTWGLMYLGWRGRQRRQGDLARPPAAPPGLHDRAQVQGIEGTYVSTTTAGDWLDRVSAHGLGTRSAAWVLVSQHGVLVARVGAPDVFTPATALRAVRRETMRAGKAIPRGGLVVWDWLLGDTLVSTAVHTRHDTGRDDLQDAITALITTRDGAADDAVGPDPKEVA